MDSRGGMRNVTRSPIAAASASRVNQRASAISSS